MDSSSCTNNTNTNNNNNNNKKKKKKKKRGSCYCMILPPHPPPSKKNKSGKAALLHLKPLISTSESSSHSSLSISLEPNRPFTIGRSTRHCNLVFEDRRVSNQHCLILFDASLLKLYLLDGSSLNGVFVNGVRIGKPEELSAGDEVLLVCAKNQDNNAPHFDGVVPNIPCCNFVPPPGKNFYLNRLEFMHHTPLSHQPVVSLLELLYPVESLSRLFIATFTSDILWFLSYCEIPFHLPVTIACHNTERCWRSGPDKRSSIPYPEFPNLVVVYPPFPEAIAFGKDRKKQGIACHHPKLLVLQRQDSIRVIITSANLVANQWNRVTNTVWWQDFPRTSSPNYSSLFSHIYYGDTNKDSKPDFAAQLAGFMASLLTDVPSQAHWIVELTKYDFGGAKGHLIASVPGIHSDRVPSMIETMQFLPANQAYSVKFLGFVEASVVGLSHLFQTAADSNGAQLKKLAAFLRKSCEKAYGVLEILLIRNKNVPADANAVSVFVPNPNEHSKGDCVQLGFLPRNVAKWVSPLWDIGFFRFSGYVCPKEALAAALGRNSVKVQLILHVSQGPHFQDISRMMQPEHVIALCSLIASVRRCSGLWRLQEVLGQYRWPESLESDFIYGASSIGSSMNSQFLAAFSAASGKRSLQSFESEESDPEWGCWSASQESKCPSIRIIFPTIERVKNACNGILPSKRILCFSEV
ncbi:hypothetical protein CMV_021808 [Castanea mollissima]|uniref:FHA domain-containing protein n=1 Tax=Castanea mollissima TaxID=60419 RepID=A0A8J4QSW5_9ROSI|nr:hypothetical protein CMV_021808 [Castanea mollissima]